MADTITINVDGVDHEVNPRQPLIEAIREAGTEVPNFCYHPDLSIAGNCRICLVEVEGPRGSMLGISCHMRPTPGMVVKTEKTSEKVRDGRKGVMEFLLVNHPLDCPICDKAGECSLQEHYMGQGRHESRLRDEIGKVYHGGVDHRFTDTKGVDRGGKNIDLGPTVVLDQERCISCSRCVRFMDEVAGEEQLYLAGRGDHTYITTFPGEELNHDYDLCTTDICPVGALTGKHFRFQQRVWFLKKVESIVPDDSLGANITIEYNNDKIWRIMPRRNADVNKSWLHNDSRLLYEHLSENRLTAAVVYGNAVTLEEGYTAAAQAIDTAQKVALVASGHLTVEDNAALLALQERLGWKAEVFGGSWLAVGESDGIARSGDPVANRRGTELLNISNNLDELLGRASEFDCLVVLGHDLWAHDAEKASALVAIKHRVVLSAWHDASVQAATVAIGVRAWAEIRGTMINCDSRAQLLQACPVCPEPSLAPSWQAIGAIVEAFGGEWPFLSEAACWRYAGTIQPAFAQVTYRAIGPEGLVLELESAAVGGEA